MNRMPRDAWEDAVIGYGGPALGSLGAGAVAVGAHMTDSQLLYALADFGFMINLFNLLPIGMMDGGRISGAISPYVGVAGLGLGGLLAYSGEIHNPIFYLILLAGGYGKSCAVAPKMILESSLTSCSKLLLWKKKHFVMRRTPSIMKPRVIMVRGINLWEVMLVCDDDIVQSRNLLHLCISR